MMKRRWVIPILALFLLIGCAKTETVLREHLRSRFPKEEACKRAERYLEKRQYEKALDELDAILTLYPDDYEVLRLKADIYYKKRDWQKAADAYGYLISVDDEKENIIRHYESKKEVSKDDSLLFAEFVSGIKEVAASLLAAKEDREEALSTAYELFFMADTETLAIRPYKKALVEEFPHSKTGYQVIVNDFYAGVYPIWRNDTARVAYCLQFLERYPETEWRFTVYQYLLSSLHRLERYAELLKVGEQLVKEQAENPFAYNYVAYFLVEEEKELDRAVQYARRAIGLWDSYEKPENLAEEQWDLNRKALFGDSRMTLARALMLKGDHKEAEGWLREAIEKTGFDANDYRSTAAYFFQLGKLLEEQGKRYEAARSYAQCLIDGDVNNTWTVKADSGLMRIVGEGSEEDIVSMVRERVGYGGCEFKDVTESMGFGDIKATRIAWADYDRDGFDDLLLSGWRIYRNMKGAGFEEVTEELGITDYTASGGIWGDWNNDGLLDFFSISGGKGEKGDRLWRQEYGGGFKDVTAEAGGVTNDFSTEGGAWGDADGDGFLDLYLANYENWADHSYFPDAFYLCKGGERFEEVSGDMGMVPPFNENRAGRGVNWGDFDNDGDLDIYVSNYRLQENFLFQNNGDGSFTNVAPLLGVAGDEVDGWWGHTIGSSWADYDNDGDLDLLAANLAHPRYIEFSNKTKLYENLGPPTWEFADRRAKAGIKYEETHSDPAWADIDNDGDLDLYLTCVYEGRKSFLYENLGDGTFKDITFLAGVRVFNGWGCAFSDFDCDGDVDLFVGSGSGVRLFENKGNGNNYLKVQIKTRGATTNIIGARVTVRQGERTQIREVQGGKGTTSQNSLVQHFGFGDDTSAVSVEVRFLNGKRVVQENIKLNQVVEISE